MVASWGVHFQQIFILGRTIPLMNEIFKDGQAHTSSYADVFPIKTGF